MTNQLGRTTRAAATCREATTPLAAFTRAHVRFALKMPALMVFAPHCSVCKSRRAAHVRFACTSINCPARLSIPLAAFSRFYGHMRKLIKRNAPSRETWRRPGGRRKRVSLPTHCSRGCLRGRPSAERCSTEAAWAPRAVVEAYSCAGSCTQHAHPASAHAHRPMPGIHARLCRSLCHGGPVPLL